MIPRNGTILLSSKDAQHSLCGLLQFLWIFASLSNDRRFLSEIQSLEQQIRSCLMTNGVCIINEEQLRMIRKILLMLDAELNKSGIDKDFKMVIENTFNLLQVNINKTKLKIIH